MLRITRYTMSTPTPQRVPTTGPYRDMLGGPWLGLLVFIVIAIGLGWGLTKLFQGMADQTRLTLDAEQLDHGFEPDVAYVLKRDLLIGVRTGGDPVIVPFKEDMPRNTPGRYTWPTSEQYAANPDAYRESHDLVGIIEQGTRVQFIEAIEDHDNAQTHLLIKTRLLTGAYAQTAAVLGMHLESADTEDETGATRYVPRADLFEILNTGDGQVQSESREQTLP